MNLTYLRIDLVRQVRDVANLAFIIGLPVVIYLVFGSGAAHSEEMVGRGNIQFYVMVSMAVYGASVATTSISGMAAVELVQGWGRQLALTPMTPPAYVATKVLIALTVGPVRSQRSSSRGCSRTRRPRPPASGSVQRCSPGCCRACSRSSASLWHRRSGPRVP